MKAEDINYMLYKDFGMDFYGNAVIASPKYIAENGPDIKAFNTATVKAMRWVVANRDQAVEMVAKIDPLIDKKLERERLDLAIDTNILTPYVKANGMGGVVTARLDNSIKQIAEAVKLKSTPAVGDIWSDAFLPAPADRKID